MRIQSHAVLLIGLCLWIPVALSVQHTASEDDEASGEMDIISGSGSGDEELPEATTRASLNTTKTAWVTDASVRVPNPTVIHLAPEVTTHAMVETAAPTTEAPLHSTTIPETHPSPTSVETHVHGVKVDDTETSTVHHVEETTTLPATYPPLLSETKEPNTTPGHVEEPEKRTTVSAVLLREEARTTVPVEVVDQTDEHDEETTPLPLTTTPANRPVDADASGDNVEATTIKITSERGFFDENTISERNNELEKSTTEDDFLFYTDNEIVKSNRAANAGSEFSMGSSSNNENLLERKEVLAGVIAGGVVGLAFAIMLVALMVYRMKKKDEGSYSLDEHKHPNGGYQKPQRQEEFLA